MLTILKLVSQTKLKIDVLCISETSLQNNDVLSDSCSFSNHTEPYFTNTETSKGGVAIFLNKKHDSHERIDLKMKCIEYEANQEKKS